MQPGSIITLPEHKTILEVKSGLEQRFSVACAVAFLLIGVYPLVTDGNVRLWCVLAAAISCLVGLISPRALVIPTKMCFKIIRVLSSVLTQILLVLVYFSSVVPTGLIVRLMGRDSLRLTPNKNAKSYWITRKQPLGSMKDQF